MTDFDAAHRRFILTEIVISICLCSTLPPIVLGILFAPFPMPVWGGAGFAMFLCKNTFGMASVMTIIMTLVTRMRIAKAKAPRLDILRQDHKWLRFVPRWTLLRAILYALFAVAVVVPICLLAVWLLDLADVGRMTFVAFNVACGVMIAGLMTPLILVSVMTDKPRLTLRQTAA